MKSKKGTKKELSRRDFIKSTAVGVGATAVAGLGATKAEAQEETSGIPANWDAEADVVVVGYGGAGAVTAITAHDAAAKVLIIEKQPADTPTKINHTCSTRFCASAMMNFNSVQAAITYLTACSRGATPADVIASWAEYAVHTKDWIVSMGGKPTRGTDSSTEYPASVLPGADDYRMYMHEGSGPGLWKTLSSAVEARQIKILYETPAKELVQDPHTKEILGVKVESGGWDKYIKARKAVVLTCGGFEFDFEMLDTYVWAHPCRFYANPGNTGDGVKMAQAVGAQLWHMPLIGGRVIAYFDELGFGINAGSWSPYVHVDKYGRRFLRMPWKSHSAVWQTFYWDEDLADFPAVPCFSIFDQSAVNARGALFGKFNYSDYVWSADNSAEIAKGWILKGDTIEELAGVIAKDPHDAGRMKPDVLADTLSRYNQYCAEGKDPELGSAPNTLKPVRTPPYYAIKLYPGGVNTFGGPKRNAKGQVVNSFNKPIPRLYSGGELGSILGFLYSGGGWNICEVVVSGQIAGKNAAAEVPWS